ncbi:ribosome maturation factor RimM [Candidatus Moduliflexota bacterium]
MLKIAEEEIKKLPAGEYYRFQLQGLTVVTDEDRELGQIVEIMATGSNLVLVVRGEGGEILLPYIDDVVLAVDIEAGRMTVHLLEGLLPEA